MFGMEKLRLSKLMSQRGLASRREADMLIEKGCVFVDGIQVNELGTKVLPNVKVTLDRAGQNYCDSKVTIILNKPLGYVSCLPEDDHPPALKLVTHENRFNKDGSPMPSLSKLAPAGRLDIDSTGTHDLHLRRCFSKKKSLVKTRILKKEYIVKVAGKLDQDKIALLTFGLVMDGEKLKKCDVTLVRDNVLRLVLKQGKKRQIRRMMEMVDLKVTALTRIRIGPYKLDKLPLGAWQLLP